MSKSSVFNSKLTALIEHICVMRVAHMNGSFCVLRMSWCDIRTSQSAIAALMLPVGYHATGLNSVV